MAIRVLAADEHEMVLLGLQNLFAGTDIQIVATAKSATEVVKQVRRHKPDVVLMEARMNARDGLAVLERIKLGTPSAPVIIFSCYDDLYHLARAYALGAAGYVLKRDQPSRVIHSIRQAAGGQSAWSPDDLKRIIGGIDGDCGVSLTGREGEVLKQLSHGLTNKEIAKALKISYETVKEHVQKILRKLGVEHRTQAALWAIRKQVV